MSRDASFAFRLSPWDSYLLQVEDGAGRRFTDGHTIDMLYTLHLHDVPVEQAIEAVGGLEQATAAVKRAVAQLREDVMDHDPRPDPALRFTGRVRRPALIRNVPRDAGFWDGVLAWTVVLMGVVMLAIWAVHGGVGAP